jgi:hypothetical protein
MSKIMRCTCTHPFQDSRYGAGMRVHNETKSGHCCTVCSKGAGSRQAEWKKYRCRKAA